MQRELHLRSISPAAAIVVSFALSGCFQNDYERLRVPNYASPVGTDSWEVNCGNNVFIIDDDAMDEFYKSDGTAKTYMEFCEAEPSLIRREED